jgi:hypothetical protein
MAYRELGDSRSDTTAGRASDVHGLSACRHSFGKHTVDFFDAPHDAHAKPCALA